MFLSNARSNIAKFLYIVRAIFPVLQLHWRSLPKKLYN